MYSSRLLRSLPHRPQACPTLHPIQRVSSREKTYAGELDTAVTALGGSAALLDVQDPGITTGRLDDACPVGGGVVSANRLSALIHENVDISVELAELTGCGDGMRHEWEPLLRFVVRIVEVITSTRASWA